MADRGLEERTGYRFKNPDLLELALTHRSWRQDDPRRFAPSTQGTEGASDNETLEFLGDAILGMLVSEALFRSHPGASEGELSSLKAQFVSAAHLGSCATELDLGAALRLGKGEEKNGGRLRPTLLANAFEAVLAAVYLDGGIEPARTFVQTHVLAGRHLARDAREMPFTNFIGLLQEKAQAQGLPLPSYRDVETSGPEHARTFVVEVSIDGQYNKSGTGSSKKSASQKAAKALLEELGWTAVTVRAS